MAVQPIFVWQFFLMHDVSKADHCLVMLHKEYFEGRSFTGIPACLLVRQPTRAYSLDDLPFLFWLK
jgi:hypothetical protein